MLEYLIIVIFAWFGMGQIIGILFLLAVKRSPQYYLKRDFKPQSKLEKTYSSFCLIISWCLFPLMFLTFKLIDDIEETYLFPLMKKRWLKWL